MRLRAPEFFVSADVNGNIIDANDLDENREIVVLNPEEQTTLQALGFVHVDADAPQRLGDVMAELAARQASEEAEADAGGGPDPVETATAERGDYPALFAAIEARGHELPSDVSVIGLLAYAETIAEGLEAEPAEPVQYEVGGFVSAALASKGITDLSDLQAVFDAIEAQFEPFKAFDPNGDFRPGGPAPDAEQDGGAADQQEEQTAEPEDPAEKPDFSNKTEWPQPKIIAWLKPRGVELKVNVSHAVAAQAAEDYWAEKHPAE